MAVRRPLPADAAIEPPKIRVTFQASCAPCDYAGPGRASSLTALEDFDAHVAGDDHQRSERQIADAISPTFVYGPATDSDEETADHDAEIEVRHAAYHGE